MPLLGCTTGEDLARAAGGVLGIGMIGFVVWLTVRPAFRK